MKRCVVLNGDYTYLNTVSIRRAIALVIKEKVEILKYDESDTIKCSDGKCFKIPLVMRLIKIIRMIYKNRVPYSKRNIMIRDNNMCCYCGSFKDLTIDHVIPRSRGGKSTFENCVTACRECNNLKGNRTPAEAKMYLHSQPYAPTISEFFRIKMKQLGVESYLKEVGIF